MFCLETQVHLRRDDNVVPIPAKVLDGPTHDALGLATGVGFGGIEEVDASVEGGFEACEGILVANVPSVLTWSVL